MTALITILMLVYGMVMFALGVWAGERKAALMLEETFPSRRNNDK